MFGMVDVSHTPALGYMEIVPRRNAATLLPIINSHVRAGTTVYSDEWAAYNRVGTLPNVSSHATFNHSLHFVDPVTGTHTQNRELLEQGEAQAKKNEGLPCPAPSRIPGRIYVEGEIRYHCC